MAAENRAAQTVLLGDIWELRVTLPKEETLQTFLLLGLCHNNIMLGFTEPQIFFFRYFQQKLLEVPVICFGRSQSWILPGRDRDLSHVVTSECHSENILLCSAP